MGMWVILQDPTNSATVLQPLAAVPQAPSQDALGPCLRGEAAQFGCGQGIRRCTAKEVGLFLLRLTQLIQGRLSKKPQVWAFCPWSSGVESEFVTSWQGSVENSAEGASRIQ